MPSWINTDKSKHSQNYRQFFLKFLNKASKHTGTDEKLTSPNQDVTIHNCIVDIPFSEGIGITDIAVLIHRKFVEE